jgi:hypothetical protein
MHLVIPGAVVKSFVVKSLEAFSILGFVLVVLFFAVTGYQRAAWSWDYGYGYGGPGTALLGLLFGAAIGFVIATIVFGTLFVLLDIAENSRRTRELIEAEANRHRAPAA